MRFGAAAAAAHDDQYLHVSVKSSVLSAFWRNPIAVEAYVLLPDDYYRSGNKTYPVLYWIQGFGGTGQIDLQSELNLQRPMRSLHREFVVVLLNGMFNGGDTEFADSANYGPWGTALTTEFMPSLEYHLRIDGTHRFVGGHSSGGWAALWLQITYPRLFAAEWSLSPDPVDFRDFIGPDLTRTPPQNFFKDDKGNDYTIDSEPLRRFVTGPGWETRQFDSFDAVFSPRGPDGKALQLFDRRTGSIDPAVEEYWEKHWDIAALLRKNWPVLGPQLAGKIHIFVGGADEFGLERPVKLLEEELRSLGSDAEIQIVPGANHGTIFNYQGNVYGYIFSEAGSMLPAP